LPAPDEFAFNERHPQPRLSPVLAFLIQQVTGGENDTQGTNESILRIVLAEFGGPFLRSKEAYAVDAQLPGAQAKGLYVVKSYYSARQAAILPIKAEEPALFCASAEKNKLRPLFGLRRIGKH